MKMCKAHWDELREAIRARGIYDMVAPTGEEAARRIAAAANGTATEKTFDPLMYAMMAIMGQGMRVAGIDIMMPKVDGGDHCPLCYLVENCKCGKPECDFRTWIEKAADESLEAAREFRPPA